MVESMVAFIPKVGESGQGKVGRATIFVCEFPRVHILYKPFCVAGGTPRY